MKITLDVDKLLQEGKIDHSDYERLKGLALEETTSLALNVLLGSGVVAVGGGMLALLASSIASMAIGIGVVALGLYLGIYYAKRWKTLSGISILIGALMFGGGLVTLTEGNFGGLVILTILYLAVGIAVRNSLMIVLSAFSLLAALGAMTEYSHASYFLSIDKPLLSIVTFSALGIGSYFYSLRTTSEYERLMLVFARTCLFIVNMAFWIGSLWGDNLFGKRDYWSSDETIAVPDLAFVIVWAIALIIVGIWAAKNNRRWAVNLVAVFGAIHFYTQWFERLGATPGSIVIAGAITIGIALILFRFNQASKIEKAA
jgi:iron complex transport system permease protein